MTLFNPPSLKTQKLLGSYGANFSAMLSSLLLLAFFYYIYDLFQRFDWGQPFTKFLCFSSIFFLILIVGKNEGKTILSKKLVFYFEIIISILCLTWIGIELAPKYLKLLSNGPWVDIGYTTQNSAIVLFKEGLNPYLSETINVRPELKPEHRGFHYGPGMLIGYWASAVWPNIGYKITNLVYLIGTIVTLSLLISGELPKKIGLIGKLSSCLLVTALLLMPERLWYELFQQGANDIFPIFLLLLGGLFFQRNMLLLAGIILGFSFSTKFSPAAFLLVLFLRKDITLRFFIGCVIGCFPMYIFMLWDYKSLLENVFILRFTLNFDSTSLYSILPRELHYVFPLLQLSAVVFLLIINFSRPSKVSEIFLHFSLLLIIIEVTFKEMHANHLIWFYPIFAFVVVKNRWSLYSCNWQRSSSSAPVP